LARYRDERGHRHARGCTTIFLSQLSGGRRQAPLDFVLPHLYPRYSRDHLGYHRTGQTGRGDAGGGFGFGNQLFLAGFEVGHAVFYGSQSSIEFF